MKTVLGEEQSLAKAGCKSPITGRGQLHRSRTSKNEKICRKANFAESFESRPDASGLVDFLQKRGGKNGRCSKGAELRRRTASEKKRAGLKTRSPEGVSKVFGEFPSTSFKVGSLSEGSQTTFGELEPGGGGRPRPPRAGEKKR